MIRLPTVRNVVQLAVLCAILCTTTKQLTAEVSATRRSAVVNAVQQARPSVVNITGQKTVRSTDQYSDEPARRVNGMGTGVVIDGRGYILTNYHVVDGVRRIRVALHNGQAYIANLVAHDPVTDLAIIKISVRQPMKVVNVGSSRDIMTGETVIAVGNAYGYEHTVTTGIVSAQHRSVQVNDSQDYKDLIQTDASINPGNSGGPLLNIDGQMIGVNVAVRVGAQGIGFAIPVDRAMQVAARLMNASRISGVWHGVISEETVRDDRPVVIVRDVQSGSPASRAGLREGDVIKRIGNLEIERALDLERALLDSHSGESVHFALQRADQPVTVTLALATSPADSKGRLTSTTPQPTAAETKPPKDVLGLKTKVVSSEEVKQQSERFRGGLLVTALDSHGLAATQGIREGDILVGMHVWETISHENLAFILSNSDFDDLEEIEFFVLRDKQTLSGRMPTAALKR
jgi:serine protease Do